MVYPNPVNDNTLNLKITSASAQNITLIINDVFGRRMIQRSIHLVTGDNNYQLNIRSIAAGNYYAVIIPKDGSSDQVQKFIKK